MRSIDTDPFDSRCIVLLLIGIGTYSCLSAQPIEQPFEQIEVKNIDADPRSEQFFRYPAGVELESQNFELLQGKGIPVCEAYTEYLATQKYPHCGPGPRCYRWYLKEYAGISRPSFEILDDEAERQILVELNTPEFPSPYHSTVWKMLDAIDIDNDGNNDQIYMYTRNRCDERTYDRSNAGFKIHPYPWDEAAQTVNIELAKDLARSIEDPERVRIGSNQDDVYSFFLYEGNTYIDYSATYNNQSIARPPIDRLNYDIGRLIRIFRIEERQKEVICEIRTEKFDPAIEHQQCDK